MTALHIYDGNNVLLRDLEKPNGQRITLRQRFEDACDSNTLHIWAWDGRGHNQRRQTIYPKYKSKRTPAAEDRYAQIGVFRQALEHSNAIQVECDGWEGDDVIGALVKRFSANGGLPITVHSNDGDYLQLLSYPLVTLNGVKKYEGCPAHRIALYKAMCGDSSDNIEGIPNFGKKSFAAMEPYWATIEKAIDEQDLPTLLTLPFKPGAKAWLSDAPNLMLLRCMITITRFLPIADEELEKGIRRGQVDKTKADQLFRKYFL